MRLSFLVLVLLMCGCTSVQITAIDKSLNIKHLCIKNNILELDEQISGDYKDTFESVVEKVFNRHGITTEVYFHKRPSHCQFFLTYAATVSFEKHRYLSHVDLGVYTYQDRIGSLRFRLTEWGEASPLKWRSLEANITRALNRLLAEYG